MHDVDIGMRKAMDGASKDVLKIEGINTYLQSPLDARELNDRLDPMERAMHIGALKNAGISGNDVYAAGITACGGQFLRKMIK